MAHPSHKVYHIRKIRFRMQNPDSENKLNQNKKHHEIEGNPFVIQTNDYQSNEILW